MRLPTRACYALYAMTDIALHGGDAPVGMAEVPERQQRAPSYVPPVLSTLTRAGLLRKHTQPKAGHRGVPFANPQSILPHRQQRVCQVGVLSAWRIACRYLRGEDPIAGRRLLKPGLCRSSCSRQSVELA